MFHSSHLRHLMLVVCALIFALGLGACRPAHPGTVDEEKEPQFLIGRSRVNAMNYTGAIEAFEQALEMNPRSAAAHFELGWLYAEKGNDPAAAIYHYQRFLSLRPGAFQAETVRQHIYRLKQELAKAVMPIPPTPELQRQLELISEQNRQLQEEVDRLRAEVVQARAMQSVSALRATTASGRTPTTYVTPGPAVGGQSPSVYTVKAGDTPIAIARTHGITLEALMAANPGLDPRRMKVGEKVNIPAR